jgi:hypothetical protein
MPINYGVLDNKDLVQISDFDIGSGIPDNMSVKEINIVESLLSPSAQVLAVMQSDIYNPPGKNFDDFKNKDMSFTLELKGGSQKKMKVKMKTYRLDNRSFVQNNLSNVEEMVFHAIDETVLEDAKCLVSKSWKCTQPSKIVSSILEECLKAENSVVDNADPARDYIAENIHPFRVIAQQAEVALDGDDPSFLHFMTVDEEKGSGVHHFQSLKKLTKESPIQVYQSEPTQKGTYKNKTAAISFSFPCDFDYLSDLLNGLDENGQNQNSMSTIDMVKKQFMKLMGGGEGSDSCDCGLGQYNYKVAQSNKTSAEQRNSCNLDVETHLLKRQARMALLEKDKIALRITVPWDPALHAGKVIKFEWKNKYSDADVYGHGDYLIVSMMHTIRMGGYAVTTMDCVAKTVGEGEV